MCALACLSSLSNAFADSRFHLYNPNDKSTLVAVVTDSTLTISNADGNALVYKRNRRLDVRGKYDGYLNTRKRHAIRWPIGGKGSLQFGRVSFDGGVRFVTSKTEIRIAKGAKAGSKGGVAGKLSKEHFYRLSNKAWPAARALGAGAKKTAQMQIVGTFESQYWQFSPVIRGGKGVVRLTNAEHGLTMSLGIDPATGTPVMEKTASVKRQHWLLTPTAGGTFEMTNAALPGYALDSTITMKKASSGVSQRWTLATLHRVDGKKTDPVVVGTTPRRRFPVRKLISNRIVPNPALKPAKVRFSNKHRKELWVLVNDARNPRKPLRLRIPAGKSASTELDRDPGGVRVLTYEVEYADGSVKTEIRKDEILPQSFYDVSVYEMSALQININPRTRKKTVTYSPRSVGAFSIAAGNKTKTGEVIDTYSDARAEKNSGAVRRINLKEWQTETKVEDGFERRLPRGRN